MAERPTFVRIDYLNPETGVWEVGHSGYNLMDPQRYVDKINAEGKTIARAVDKTTGTIFSTPGYPKQLTPERKQTMAKHKVKRKAEHEPVPDISSLAKAPKRKPKPKVKAKTKAQEVTVSRRRGDDAVVLVDDFDDFSDLAEFDDEADDITPIPAPVLVDEDEVDSLLDEVTDEIPDIEEAGGTLFIGMPTTRDYIFDGHAGAGPSGSGRWISCTASLGASRAFLETLTPNQMEAFAKGSTAARQGTTAHAAAESEARFMLGEIDEAEHDNNILELSMLPDVEGEQYDEEMGEWLAEYGEVLRMLHQEGHPILIEQSVTAAIPLLTASPNEDGVVEPDVHEIRGSADAISMPIPTDPVLTVADLKYGNGKNVEAEDNSQAMIYALAVLAMLIEMGLDIFDKKVLDHIDLLIIQPRLGGTKTWSITVDELLDWQDETLTPALTYALGGVKKGATFTPSDEACEWCPARGTCPALAEFVMEGASDLFDEIQENELENGADAELDVSIMAPERLAELLAQAEALVKLKDDLKAEAQRRLHRGETVPGYQLVNYQPPRQWVDGTADVLDPTEVDEDLLDPQVAATLWKSPVLMSPTQALKALKAAGVSEKVLDELIVTPDKKPVVAKEGDRRSKWVDRPPEQMFDDETGSDA